ncbi:MAG TPA: hypothetical protein VG737_07110 [Cyclobacteriaceae bacterium]|nr:hypothetical protein [Cyclobacteriaceae bacterium]
MENRSVFAAFRSFLLFIALAAVFSCSTPTITPTVDSQQMATTDGVVSILTDEIDDMVLVALNTSAASGSGSAGRMEVVTDDRLKCAAITFSDVDPADRAYGKMTIAFPSEGCVDGIKANIRKGTITVTWTGGRWYRSGSTHTIALTDYNVNGISITGSRTLDVTSYTFTSAAYYSVIWAVSANHKLTWPDGTFTTISSTFTKQWDHASNQETYTYSNPDASVGTFSAQGTNRHGKKFTASITTPLIAYYSCVLISRNFIPLYGVKSVTNVTDNITMSINYGDYTCDNAFTLIIGSGSIALRAKNNSSDD